MGCLCSCLGSCLYRILQGRRGQHNSAHYSDELGNNQLNVSEMALIQRFGFRMVPSLVPGFHMQKRGTLYAHGEAILDAISGAGQLEINEGLTG
ncbi:hypothetical protein BOTBODRAFT_504939 [Botryobasidium botryosum FD-172 SS1]|uniref:Uncharacterized protein n=1 Tax=Botryobasidium botryosum (strain FD-172 SS1) TaxID=930990 RepID=A0A067ME68_BOTB1|nr:hypothetical protein BOTBODRAFT_504939 [Botryobasidium botryosum FD-172 SS1]